MPNSGIAFEESKPLDVKNLTKIFYNNTEEVHGYYTEVNLITFIFSKFKIIYDKYLLFFKEWELYKGIKTKYIVAACVILIKNSLTKGN